MRLKLRVFEWAKTLLDTVLQQKSSQLNSYTKSSTIAFDIPGEGQDLLHRIVHFEPGSLNSDFGLYPILILGIADPRDDFSCEILPYNNRSRPVHPLSQRSQKVQLSKLGPFESITTRLFGY